MAKGRERMKIKKSGTVMLYWVLRLLVIASLVLELFERDYYGVFLCVLTLVLFMISVFVDKKLNIKLPSLLECIILLFIFSAEILGELRGFYMKFAYWDTILHTLNGFIMAGIGLAMIDILNRTPSLRFSLSSLFTALVAFCFSMTVGVLWEFFEFGADCLAYTDMQKDTVCRRISTMELADEQNEVYVITDIDKTVISGRVNGEKTDVTVEGYLDIGLLDTMEDLAVNCVGALAFSFFGVFYLKGKNKLAMGLVPSIKEDTEEKR